MASLVMHHAAAVVPRAVFNARCSRGSVGHTPARCLRLRRQLKSAHHRSSRAFVCSARGRVAVAATTTEEEERGSPSPPEEDVKNTARLLKLLRVNAIVVGLYKLNSVDP